MFKKFIIQLTEDPITIVLALFVLLSIAACSAS